MSADLFPLFRPLLHALPPEAAHRLTLLALRAGLAPTLSAADGPVLRTSLWGREFSNPIGLAAGFDKDGAATAPLSRNRSRAG